MNMASRETPPACSARRSQYFGPAVAAMFAILSSACSSEASGDGGNREPAPSSTPFEQCPTLKRSADRTRALGGFLTQVRSSPSTGRYYADLHTHFNGVAPVDRFVNEVLLGVPQEEWAARASEIAASKIEILREICPRLGPALNGSRVLKRLFGPECTIDPCGFDFDVDAVMTELFAATNDTPFPDVYPTRGAALNLPTVQARGSRDEVSERLIRAADTTFASQRVGYTELSNYTGTAWRPSLAAVEMTDAEKKRATDARVLCGIDTGRFVSGTHVGRQLDRLLECLQRPDAVGLDIYAPETEAWKSVRVQGGPYCRLDNRGNQALVAWRTYLSILVEVARARRRPLIFRPHAGEGAIKAVPDPGEPSRAPRTDVDDPGDLYSGLGVTPPKPWDRSVAYPYQNVHGVERASSGEPTFYPIPRNNMTVLLDVLECFSGNAPASENQAGAYGVNPMFRILRPGETVPWWYDWSVPYIIVRVGHAAHTTVEHAQRMSALGVSADINLGSNWTSGAIQPKRAPAVLPRDAKVISLEGERDFFSMFIDHGVGQILDAGGIVFAGTDGTGVMWTDIAQEEERIRRLAELRFWRRPLTEPDGADLNPPLSSWVTRHLRSVCVGDLTEARANPALRPTRLRELTSDCTDFSKFL
jgi:hypothetical protein